MAHYFTLPVPARLQEINSALSAPRRPRKRKRGPEHEESNDSTQEDEGGTDEDENEEDSNPKDPSDNEDIQVLASPTQRKKRSPPPHPYPFPHAPPPFPRSRDTDAGLLKELSELHPPLYPAHARGWGPKLWSDNTKLTNLRHYHLGVLTTILHRCLLEADYERAGRAWGLLLRSEAGSKPIDLRRDGRWGIGAEILLQRQPDKGSSDEIKPSVDQIDPLGVNKRLPADNFSDENFQAAREYYDRLILQYPWQRMSQHSSLNASKFYPAMFSLWIFEACELSKRANRKLGADYPKSSTYSDISSETSTPATSPPTDEHKRAEARAHIKVRELKEAREIADRLDRLLSSPPYDNHGNMLELRGMVHLWIADLLDESIGDDSFGRGDDILLAPNREPERGEGASIESLESPSKRGRHKNILKGRQAELLKAQTMFDRAKNHGGLLHLNMSRLSVEVDSSLD